MNYLPNVNVPRSTLAWVVGLVMVGTGLTAYWRHKK